VAFVGDVVGTGSSRKSACNSVLWCIGDDIPAVPNKRRGGVIIGGVIAPIFFNTAQDSGALPLRMDVSNLNMGDIITINTAKGEVANAAGEVITTFEIKPSTVPDEYRAGGRVPLIIGRAL
ncbi:MAG: aconitate hydratase B, partial [Desulfuromonadaceae bacterium]